MTFTKKETKEGVLCPFFVLCGYVVTLTILIYGEDCQLVNSVIFSSRYGSKQ
jgi:hypothetical protein